MKHTPRMGHSGTNTHNLILLQQNLGLLAPNRYSLDLSNEFLNIHFGQGFVKIQTSKLDVQKISTRSAGPRARRIQIQLSWWFFFWLQLWPLIFLKSLDLQECTVFHLKYLLHICLEPDTKGPGMTFRVLWVVSKTFYLIGEHLFRYECPSLYL